jgi:hypothetical protein
MKNIFTWPSSPETSEDAPELNLDPSLEVLFDDLRDERTESWISNCNELVSDPLA